MKYSIEGNTFPVVACYLENGEKMITESGSMVWMTPNMEMQTSGGGMGKVLGRMLGGENLFQNIYTSHGDGMITFGSSFPGRIIPIEVDANHSFILQKRAFLASEAGVELSTFFRRKFGAGLFAGEGFIMQKLTGKGMAFAEIDGELMEYVLKPGEQLIVDTGNVAGFEETVSMDIQQIKGAKNVLFGGEGLFNTVLTGPGKVWLQTMPISNIASAVAPYISKSSN